MKRVMQLVILLPLLIYMSMLAFLYFYQRDLQYFPDRQTRTPAELGASGFEEVTLRTSDGETLVSWYKPAPAGRPTILYFRGNGGNASTSVSKSMTYGENFGVLTVEYRGYGKSSGTPSEQGLINDGHTAYDWLINQGVTPDKLFLLGESLGTGVAVQIAAAKPVRALALEAPYANAVDIGAQRYWYMPVRWVMKDQFRSADHIKQVKVPLLIMHGTLDRTVPFTQGQRLFELANEPKQFIEAPELGHDLIADETTWRRVIEFFNSVVQP
jgi:uncharacterized protein